MEYNPKTMENETFLKYKNYKGGIENDKNKML